jgi:hypothetical protein
VIRVEFIEPNDEAWKDWIDRCILERTDLETNFTLDKIELDPETRPSINENLYKEQKEALLSIFNGKCGYCESLITANQPGDVEHFRPKGRVKDQYGKIVTRKFKNGKELPHFAYFWLAYERTNLFPACSACNRPTKLSGNKFGKWDMFPVRGFRATSPGEEDQEEPLLLNPWTLDDTEKHFKFDETGIVAGLTEEARMCIKILGLNREGLVDSRREVYETAHAIQFTLIEAIKHKAIASRDNEKKKIAAYRSGKKPFSAVGRLAIAVAKREVEAELENV